MGEKFWVRERSYDPNVVLFGKLRFWAERGLIHIEDGNDNSYNTISVRTALQRMNAISEMLANSGRRVSHTFDQFDQANVRRHQDMLDGLQEICRRAQIQGMPTDPTAVRDMHNRRPKTVLVPGYGGGL